MFGIIFMGKLKKQSPGVGKYLKYHKEKVTGDNLPNVIQQTNGAEPTEICPNCGGDPIQKVGINKHCEYCDFYW